MIEKVQIDQPLLRELVRGPLCTGDLAIEDIAAVAVEEGVVTHAGESWCDLLCRLMTRLAQRCWTCRGPATLNILAMIHRAARERRRMPATRAWLPRKGRASRAHAEPHPEDPSLAQQRAASSPLVGDQTIGDPVAAICVRERVRLLGIVRCVVTHLIESGDLAVDDVLEAHAEELARGVGTVGPARLLVRVLDRARRGLPGALTANDVLARITAAIRFRPATDRTTMPRQPQNR